MTEEGPKVQCESTEYVMPATLLECERVPMQGCVLLSGSLQRFGMAWRPAERGVVERLHQELEKILGMLVSNVKRVPMCKHAGAAFLALAAEQCGNAEQSRTPSASDWIISPERRAELERP
eukprot:11093233-Alexandrium_andersonii.AAC.1